MKRMNITIKKMIMCMLHDVKLPKSFWPEAMHSPVDWINLSHLDLLDSDVPKRA